MRTAVCLSGQPREVSEVWQTFRDHLYKNMPNPDVFIYTSQDYACPDFFNEIKPAAYVIEDQFRHIAIEDYLRAAGFYAEHRIDPTIQQFYGTTKVRDLVKSHEEQNGFKYDLIVRTRPDFIYLRPVTLDIFDLTKLNNFHMPGALSMSTEFAIGPREEMNKYFGLYDWLATEGIKYLTPANPRLEFPPDHKYNCDVIMVTYIEDYLKMQLGTPKYAPDATWPYDYYRIYIRHVKGQYNV
jgi:hypothetical protein